MKIIKLLPKDIVLDEAWNSRKEYIERPDAEEPSQKFSTAQLEISIKEQGILQPPCVRLLDDGQYAAVYGFRRILAARKVMPDTAIDCSVYEPEEEQNNDANARLANLAENLHREDLKPWEIAESIYQIKKAHRIAASRIAPKIGISVRYAQQLIQLREKAHPTIWKQYQKWGTSLNLGWHQIREVVLLPKERQLKAWNEFIAAKQNKKKARGKEQKPGPAKLRKYLNLVDRIQRSAEYRRGLKAGLKIALGEQKWKE